MDDAQLSPTSEAVLEEITSYHRERFLAFEKASRGRRRAEARREAPYLSRAIASMAAERLDGAEREFFQETARLAGQPFDAQRILVPWEFFRRDLTAANAAQGGYLLGVDPEAARDILRPWSFTLRGGVEWLESLEGQVTVAKTTAGITVVWQQTEAAQATPSTPTIGQIAMTPKTAIGLIQCSRLFMTQADPERWIRRELLRTAGTIADRAVLSGTGASGEPLGLLNTTGIGTQAGASLAWAGVLSMKRKAADKNAHDGSGGRVAFVATPAVREILEGRDRFTGGGRAIWEDEKIASCDAFATNDMPSATMVSGPMASIAFGIWGRGVTVEVNPFDAVLFKTGGVQVRVVLSCDVGVLCDPAAFTKATSIT